MCHRVCCTVEHQNVHLHSRMQHAAFGGTAVAGVPLDAADDDLDGVPLDAADDIDGASAMTSFMLCSVSAFAAQRDSPKLTDEIAL